MNSRARASASSKLAASGDGNFSTVCAHSARRPGRRRGFGHGFLEVVHVGEARRAGPNHLGAGEPRAERDEVGPHELALDRHHVAHQPHVQAQIVGQSAQQRHRRVGVRIDKPGHHHAPSAVDGLSRFDTRASTSPTATIARRVMATDPGACTVNCSSIVRTCALVSSRSQARVAARSRDARARPVVGRHSRPGCSSPAVIWSAA